MKMTRIERKNNKRVLRTVDRVEISHFVGVDHYLSRLKAIYPPMAIARSVNTIRIAPVSKIPDIK